MSYLSDASLVMIPSGVEAGTVFTSKPAGGSADLTFTRSNDTATRVGPNGYIEKVRTNLLTYSQDFSAAAGWGGSGITATANYGTAPDGTNTSTQIVFTSGSQIWRKDAGVNGLYGNFSLWIKGTAGETITLTFGNNSDKVVTLGSGWNRFSTDGNLATNPELFINTFVGATARTIEVWGGQAEVGDIATDYIETTTAAVSVGPVANVPRINFDPVLPRTGSLLLEPQRTNLALYSEQIDNAVWTKDGTTATANQTASPSGYADADLVTNNGLSGDHTIYQAIALSATTYTVSAYVKKNTESYVHLTLNFGGNENEWATATFNLDTATSANYANTLSTPSSTITAFGTNGWYRVTMTCTLANTANHILLIGFAKAGAPDTSRGRYVTANTNSFYIWGCQTEEGAYPTSYIPTYSAAVTRGADTASKTGISSLIGQTEGALFFEYIPNVVSSSTSQDWIPIGISDGTSANSIYINDYNDLLYFVIQTGGVTQMNYTYPNLIANNTYKIAIGYANNDAVVYINGTQVNADTSVSVPSMSKISLNSFTSPIHISSITVNKILLFQTRLTNDQLSQITTL